LLAARIIGGMSVQPIMSPWPVAPRIPGAGHDAHLDAPAAWLALLQVLLDTAV
jgi:hypothetical protein